METIVVINGVEYAPKETVISKTVVENLAKAYSDSFSIIYGPNCGNTICRREWRKLLDILEEINREVGFKK